MVVGKETDLPSTTHASISTFSLMTLKVTPGNLIGSPSYSWMEPFFWWFSLEEVNQNIPFIFLSVLSSLSLFSILLILNRMFTSS